MLFELHIMCQSRQYTTRLILMRPSQRCVRHHTRGAVPRHLDLELFLPFSHVVLQSCHTFLLRCVVGQVDLVETADILLSDVLA